MQPVDRGLIRGHEMRAALRDPAAAGVAVAFTLRRCALKRGEERAPTHGNAAQFETARGNARQLTTENQNKIFKEFKKIDMDSIYSWN